LPRELGLLRALEELMLDNNRLVAVPAELGKLPLTELWLRRNRLCWLPLELDGLAATTIVTVRVHRFFHDRRLTRRLQLDGNAFPLVNVDGDARPRLRELFAWTTHIGMIRERAMAICIALQDLELPAFVTLAIVDEAVPENEIRMWAKWELITAVKHFDVKRNGGKKKKKKKKM
jgi:Leucine-rich repeat (LRR) protein